MAEIKFRRRNAASTRAELLRAAQVAFSETGYSHTGLRTIAAAAGTTATMAGRYFGSKAGLFEAALTAAMHVNELLELDHAGLGKHLAETILSPDADIRPPLMISLAAGDPEARAIAGATAERELLIPLMKSLDGPDARARALAMIMLATGFVAYMRQIPLTPPSESERAYLVNWFANSMQRLVDGSQDDHEE